MDPEFEISSKTHMHSVRQRNTIGLLTGGGQRTESLRSDETFKKDLFVVFFFV